MAIYREYKGVMNDVDDWYYGISYSPNLTATGYMVEYAAIARGAFVVVDSAHDDGPV